jgi:hypothetical protein
MSDPGRNHGFNEFFTLIFFTLHLSSRSHALRGNGQSAIPSVAVCFTDQYEMAEILGSHAERGNQEYFSPLSTVFLTTFLITLEYLFDSTNQRPKVIGLGDKFASWNRRLVAAEVPQKNDRDVIVSQICPKRRLGMLKVNIIVNINYFHI